MSAQPASPSSFGTLYVVATPIGNLDDLSPRAVSVLSSVDRVAAEDTRHSGRLLQHLGLSKPMLALHDHNERDRAASLLARLEAGESIALVSDAGTPLISDPGYLVVRQARERGIRVTPIPGPCALVVALSAAGLPTDRFVFEGFLPAKSGARRSVLAECVHQTATMIFYESPHRIADSVADLVQVFGAEREVVLARELTKTFETYYSGPAASVLEALQADPHGERGEFVMMVRGAEREDIPEGAGLDVDRLLKLLLSELPVKKAAKLLSEATAIPKNELYRRALALKEQ